MSAKDKTVPEPVEGPSFGLCRDAAKDMKVPSLGYAEALRDRMALRCGLGISTSSMTALAFDKLRDRIGSPKRISVQADRRSKLVWLCQGAA